MIPQATKVWSESTVARIMKLTEEAQSSRPKLERWLDEFTERYSQLVLAMSVAVALLGPVLFKWPFLGTQGTMFKNSAKAHSIWTVKITNVICFSHYFRGNLKYKFRKF